MAADKQAKIQFYDGVDEPVVPEIRLTRGNDGIPDKQFLIWETSSIIFYCDGEITWNENDRFWRGNFN